MIRNVHQREFTADPILLGHLLDRIAEPGNQLWPSPAWPPMRLDQPLAVGAAGGHGPIRYTVQDYQRGRRVVCRFDSAMGLVGFHALDVLPGLKSGRVILRHEIIARTKGRGRLLWPLVFRWLHDALLEDLLDGAAMAVGQATAKPARWSWWVRRLRASRVRHSGRAHGRSGSVGGGSRGGGLAAWGRLAAKRR